jgi:hypothetical protein
MNVCNQSSKYSHKISINLMTNEIGDGKEDEWKEEVKTRRGFKHLNLFRLDLNSGLQ